MNKRKLVSTLVLAFFLFSLLPLGILSASDEEEETSVFVKYLADHLSMAHDPLFGDVYHDDAQLVDLVLAEVNADIQEIFGVSDYYPKESIVTKNSRTKTLPVNPQFLKERRIVVYGTPQDVRELEGSNDLKDGFHRYLGYDRDGTLITNPSFPASTSPKEFNPDVMVHNLSRSADSLASRVISHENNIKYTMPPGHNGITLAGTIQRNSFDYVEINDKGLTFKNQPLSDFLSRHIAFSAALINYWESRMGKDFFNNYGIGVPEARQSLIVDGDMTFAGMSREFNRRVDALNNSYSAKGTTLHQNIHIVTPPSRHTWGTGYAFFEDTANVYVYRTILLAPLKEPDVDWPDFYAKDLTADTETVEPGKQYNGQATFGLKEYKEPVYGKISLTHNGYPVPGIDGEIALFEPEEEVTYDFIFTGQTGPSHLKACIEPVDEEGNPLEDKDLTDNCKELILEPGGLPDFYVKTLTANTGTTTEGIKYSGTVTFGLKNDYPQPMQAKLTLTHNGHSVGGVDGQTVTFEPGEEKTFDFNFTGQNGNSFLLARIDPVGAEDKNPADNQKTLDIPQLERPEPELNAKLTLQAVSIDQAVKRKPGEAKWTDRVTATLKPDAPIPPRGQLDWWKITKAELYHPKKHKDFTFGTPYQPKGHVVTPMELDSHTATLLFQQDWSMDGTPIYSMIEKKMMTTDKPRAYPIQVNYTIEYQYSWTECDEDSCWTETRTATKSSKETANLLVTGTGVNSRAN